MKHLKKMYDMHFIVFKLNNKKEALFIIIYSKRTNEYDETNGCKIEKICVSVWAERVKKNAFGTLTFILSPVYFDICRHKYTHKKIPFQYYFT